MLFRSYKAVYRAENPAYAASRLALSVLRAQIGKSKLDELFVNRENIGKEVILAMKESAERWGCEVTNFEISGLYPKYDEVSQALNTEGVAERNRRKTVLNAKAEHEKIKHEADARRYKLEQEGIGERINMLEKAKGKKESFELMSEAIKNSGEMAQEIMAMQLAEGYYKELGKIAGNNTVILSERLNDVPALLSMGKTILDQYKSTSPKQK